MSEGWFSMHRKIMDSVVWTNSDLLKLWTMCMAKASFTDRPNYVFDGKHVPLVIGQFITGRDSLAEEFNRGVKKSSRIPATTLYRWMKKLETLEMLNIKSTTKYSVVTVINYEHYQQIEQQVNNKWSAVEQQVNTNNNVLSSTPPTSNNNNINAHADAYTIYQKAFPKKPLNEFIAQSIAEWINDFHGQEDVICLAIKNAAEYSAENFKYVENTLKRWEAQGVKNVVDAQKIIDDFDQKKDKKIQLEVARQEERDVKPKDLPKVPLYNWVNPDMGVEN